MIVCAAFFADSLLRRFSPSELRSNALQLAIQPVAAFDDGALYRLLLSLVQQAAQLATFRSFEEKCSGRRTAGTNGISFSRWSHLRAVFLMNRTCSPVTR